MFVPVRNRSKKDLRLQQLTLISESSKRKKWYLMCFLHLNQTSNYSSEK